MASHWRTTPTPVLLVILVLSATMLGACQSGPETKEEAAERVLDDHLSSPWDAIFGFDHSIRPVGGVDIDGWTFFRVTTSGVDDAEPRTWVVRDDGTIVEDKKAELGAVFEALALFDREDLPTGKMVRAAAYLTGADRDVVGESSTRLSGADGWDERQVEHVDRRFPDVGVAPPRIDREHDRIAIEYYVHTRAYAPEDLEQLQRWSIEVSRNYKIEVDYEVVGEPGEQVLEREVR